MIEQSVELKILCFLNDRKELYNITDDSLKISLYDIPENQFKQGLEWLRKIGYIRYKEMYEKGLSITNDGQVRLQQLQNIATNNSKQSTMKKYPLQLNHATFWPVFITVLGGSFILGHYFGANKFDRELLNLNETNTQLKDSIKFYEKTINTMRYNSNVAMKLLRNMPFEETPMDTPSFKKIQHSIENAEAVLNLNK